MKKYIKIIIAISFLLTACSHLDQSMSENITQPVLKSQPKLIYPFSAQQNNDYGTTEVIFTISKAGEVTKANIHKSSGFKNLDNAAINYCKGLVFIPAKDHGEPITSNMKWEVKFNLKDLDKEIQSKIADVKDLYSDLEELQGSERLKLQNEILKTHNEVVNEMRDGLKFNEYIFAVVQNNIKNEWKNVSEEIPLSFLLYYDFLTRFEDYDSLRVVHSLLENALHQDLDYLNVTNKIGGENKVKNTILIKKIKRFVESNYPDINLNALDSENKVRNNNIS